MGGKLHFHASIGALVNIPGAQKSFLTDQLVKTSVNCTFSWIEFRCDGRGEYVGEDVREAFICRHDSASTINTK